MATTEATINRDRIAELRSREKQLTAALSHPANLSPADIAEQSKELARISKERELREALEMVETSRKEWTSLLSDNDMGNAAAEELANLAGEEQAARRKLEEFLDSSGTKPAATRLIIEIRAGAGGEEAALFAHDLFRMYQRFGESKGWNMRILDSHRTSVGGLKEVIAEVTSGGENLMNSFARESGVHRVQRIPETEKSGRVHTSTATVAVLRVPKAKEIVINPGDLSVETFRSSGPGGQNVNKLESAVRITHLPSGLVVFSQEGRSQNDNRENAMQMLRARLQAAAEEQAASEQGKLRRSQIGGAERSEKIRTYNIPQDRVTDHRVNENFHNVRAILDGDLAPIIAALAENERLDNAA